MHVTGYWLRVMSTWVLVSNQCQLWFALVEENRIHLHVSHRAEHLGVGEPWQEAEDNPQEGGQLHFFTLFWTFSDNLSTFCLVYDILHWPALPPRPLVLSSPAGARLSIPAPCTQSIYRLHIPGPRKMINRVLSFQDLFIFRVSYPWHRRWAYAKNCFFEKSFTTFTHLEHCGLCEVTPGSVESAWWQCYRFPNRQKSVTDFPQPTIHCYVFSPTDNTVLHIFPNRQYSVTDLCRATTGKVPQLKTQCYRLCPCNHSPPPSMWLWSSTSQSYSNSILRERPHLLKWFHIAVVRLWHDRGVGVQLLVLVQHSCSAMVATVKEATAAPRRITWKVASWVD